MSAVSEAYEPKKIVAMEDENPGWLVEFECGHVVWWAIKPGGGEGVCAVCVDNLTRYLRDLSKEHVD